VPPSLLPSVLPAAPSSASDASTYANIFLDRITCLANERVDCIWEPPPVCRGDAACGKTTPAARRNIICCVVCVHFLWKTSNNRATWPWHYISLLHVGNKWKRSTRRETKLKYDLKRNKSTKNKVKTECGVERCNCYVGTIDLTTSRLTKNTPKLFFFSYCEFYPVSWWCSRTMFELDMYLRYDACNALLKIIHSLWSVWCGQSSR